MRFIKPNRPHRFGLSAALAAVAVVVIVLLTACGGSSGANEIPSAGNDGGGQSTSTEQAPSAQAYTDCLRDEGVEMSDPDPETGLPQFGDSVNTESADVQAGLDACQDLLPAGIRGDGEDQELGPYLAYAACMRANGFPDFPDPQPGPNGMFAGSGLDRSDPAFLQANDLCGDELAGVGEQ